MQRQKVLIIEDDESTVGILNKALKDEFELFLATDPVEALKLAQQLNPTVVLLDLELPPTSSRYEVGLQLLQDIRKYASQTKVIALTGHSGRARAARALGYGAYDVFCKPIDLAVLRCVMTRACWISELETEQQKLRPTENEKDLEEMIGTSQSIRRIFDAIRKVATTDMPVLITGESGTGKELTARAIHEKSQRKEGPFVPINCGAIPETLLESELFGHERGAFTGAVQQKKGKVEYAQGGTLFLDEVAELSPTLQVKLLRFLQDSTFERVGGRQPIEINVRIMAATNADLKEAIEQSAFREDLYYRLAVMHIHLPPLRDREEDVLLMAMVFLKQIATHNQKRMQGFNRDAIEAIQAYSWPGNVRELCNKIRRAVVMSEGPYITPGDLDLPLQIDKRADTPISLKVTRQEIEVDFIVKAYTHHQGNLSRAAEELGISRSTLYRRLRRYGLL
jgi:two-component system NtrC family response regulator